MTKYFTIIIAVLFMISTSKEAAGQFYLKYELLADELKNTKAYETGEAFQIIDDSISFRLAHGRLHMKGILRILKTDGSNKLSYIPISKWIYLGSYPTISGIGRVNFRDTVTYDSLGNIIKSVSYLAKKKEFKLYTRTSSEYKDSLLIEYTEYLKNDKLTRSYYNKITDFNVPKPYDNKTKILTGTRTTYKHGKIKVKQDYDSDGKLISSGKHER